MATIVLTADKTLMSEYNKHVFLGFAACAPQVIPSWLYERIFCPQGKTVDGRVCFAHCGQRKIEAALLRSGFSEDEVAIVPPQELHTAISSDTKVVGITTHDPLGLGPASTTFSQLGGKETFTSLFFHQLITHPAIRAFGPKIIVGGSGAWQLTDERIVAKLGIDCVVVGEGELTAVDVIRKAVAGEKLPAFVQGEVVPFDQIPLLTKPTLNGLVEIARGCGRGCRFCTPTMANYRCFPLERILAEATVNVQAGAGIIYHAEDVLRYNASGFTPSTEAVLPLFSEGKKLTDNVGISHFAHASVVANPGLVEAISDIMDAGSQSCPFFSGQVGIETGSPRTIARQMKGKVKPFAPEQWPDVVRQSHQILAENHWVPAETLIVGLPGEEDADVQQTIDLIGDLAPFKSLIVPLFFVPLGNLQGQGFFSMKDATPLQWQLLAACVSHDFRYIQGIAEESLRAVKVSWAKRLAIAGIIRYMDRKMAPYLKLMAEGINPLTSLAE